MRTREGSTVELSELRDILVHRRLLIVGTAAVLTLVALVYCLFAQSLYSSTSQIIIDPRDRQVVSNDVNPSSLAPDGGITQVESQVSVAESTGVLMRAIQATDLTRDPEFNSRGTIGRLIRYLEGLPETPAPEDQAAQTIDALRRATVVKRADKVLVLDVTVTARSADKAALLANAIATAYLEDQSEARSQAARQASGGLTARLAEQRQQVQDAENAIERYKSENNMVMTAGTLVSDQVLTDLNSQLANARNATSALKARVDQFGQRANGGLAPDATSEVMQSAVISKLREQEATLQQRITDMTSKFGPRHPAMVSVVAQKRGLEQLIEKELDRIAASVQTDYQRALSNEQDLAARLDVLEKTSLVNDQASVRLRELQRDLEAVRSIYADFLKRSQETREQSGIDSTNARIISQAMPALKKKWPPIPLLLAGALFGGLGLGAGFALIAEYTSPTVLSGGQIEKTTGAVVLAVLPAESRRLGYRKRLLQKLPIADQRPGTSTLPPNLNGALGLALRRLSDRGKWQQSKTVVPSLLFTSRLEDGAERMRVSAFMAAAAASRGDRVLFIDANISRSESADDMGLLDVLSGECHMDNAIDPQHSGNISFMGVGRENAVFNETDGLSFAHDMLVDARQIFDLVVIDGGDLTENIKASPLVALASDIVLVAELKATPLDSVQAQSMAASVMGRSVTASLLVDGTV
jgi:uncharacterized protein involved in exopolysaccharide biosynthesis